MPSIPGGFHDPCSAQGPPTCQKCTLTNVLLNQVKAKAYERTKAEKKTHNFERALPVHLAEQADEAIKSRYNLEFLG